VKVTTGHQEEPLVPVGHEVKADGPSPGEQLRRAREAKGWAVDLVAERLRLHPDQIDALERDEHESFPALIFVSGYIRSYARLLDIDPDPLLASLQPVEPSTPVILRERRRQPAHGSGAAACSWRRSGADLVRRALIGPGADE
jgi:cytoskeleton protein RodZ